MERYAWRDGKIRLRLNPGDLAETGLSREALYAFGKEARDSLRQFLVTLQNRGELPAGELLVEVFPGEKGAVLQITPEIGVLCFFVRKTDEMLRLFPLAKGRGAALYRRKDGNGYYLICNEENAALFSEFAAPCQISGGVLKEACKRIL